jgi:hypothetical protein
MKHRVKRVFEWDLDGALEEIDQKGGELIRILDLPKGPLSDGDCTRCKKAQDHCDAHETALPHRLKVAEEKWERVIFLPRYAVVYKEPDKTAWPGSAP